MAVKTVGKYDPREIFFLFEEQLYTTEANTIYEFLMWVFKNNKTFGSGNYEEVFKEFIKSTTKYSLKCGYYKKSFPTIQKLIDDVIESGMDPNYYITCNGKATKEKAIDLIQF